MRRVSGAAKSHYEVLGVTPDASVDRIKKAYLAAARDAHPDFHTDDDVARMHAEDQMRRINAAWAVLSDPDERSYYDRQRLAADRAPQRPGPAFHAGSAGHEAPFRPLFDEDVEEGFDERDDRPITDSSLPRWMTMAPVVLLGGGFGGLLFGAILGSGNMMVLAIISMVVSGVLFLVAAPLIALGRAARADRRPGG